MSVLWDILDLLSSPPGALVYYLILLFCIWAIVGLALSRWWRGERGGLVARLLLAGALMSFSRFFLIVMALLSRQGDFSLVRFSPPLERSVDALSALLCCWAFVFPPRFKVADRVTLGLSVLLTLALYALSAISWVNILDASPVATYNGATMQSWIWEVWQLFFLIPAFVYTLVNPARERDALNIGLGVLVTGHLLQLVYPLAERIEYVAAWTRFANLVAFPLFGVAAYQLIVQRFDAQTADLRSVNRESLAQTASLMSVLDTNLKVFASLDWDTVLRDSVQAVSQVLQSDLCALVLMTSQSASSVLENAEPGTSRGTSLGTLVSPGAPDLPILSKEIEIAVLYDAPRFIRSDQCIRVGEYPALQQALTQSGPAVLGATVPGPLDRRHAIEELDPTYRLFGCDPGGSLLIQPLEHDSAAIGALVACRGRNQGPFTTSDARKSETLAAYLSLALENARRYQEIQVQVEQVRAELDAVETRHTRLRTDLENRLARTEEQATLYMQRLYEAELGEQQAQEDAREARRKLAALRQESQAEVTHARDELKHSIQQAAYLTQQMANLDAQCLQLGNLVQALEQEKGLLQLRLAVVATERDGSALDAESTSQPAPLLAGPGRQGAGARSADGLVATLTHDLGAPLASIAEYTELLANSVAGRLEHRHNELLKRVQANTERMQAMLNNLVGLRALDEGTPVLKLARVDMTKLIEVALARCKFRLEEKELQTRLEIGVLPLLDVDPAYMQQILDNLVSYVCRSARIGGTMEIRAFTDAQDAGTPQLRITVSSVNTGASRVAQEPGHALVHTLHRASVLCRTDSGESQAELELINTLVEVHRGQVVCENEAGTGAMLHLIIPIEPVQTSENPGNRHD